MRAMGAVVIIVWGCGGAAEVAVASVDGVGGLRWRGGGGGRAVDPTDGGRPLRQRHRPIHVPPPDPHCWRTGGGGGGGSTAQAPPPHTKMFNAVDGSRGSGGFETFGGPRYVPSRPPSPQRAMPWRRLGLSADAEHGGVGDLGTPSDSLWGWALVSPSHSSALRPGPVRRGAMPRAPKHVLVMCCSCSGSCRTVTAAPTRPSAGGRGGGGGTRPWCWFPLPLAAPIGPSPLLILTLCGSERVLVVSTEPPDDLSCLTTPGVGRPGDGAVARAGDQGHPDAPSESMRGFADSSTDLCVLVCASAGSLS